MSRRTKVGVTALAVVALTLTACGGPSKTDSGLKGADNAIGQADINPQDASKVKDGGEFRWPVDQLPDNWNYNQLDGTNADGRRMIDTVMPNLYKQKADSTIEVNKDYLDDAKLASSDPQVLEFKISSKAKWSDGTSLSGGSGSLVGTLVGALIMGVLRNGLNLLGVSSFLQQIVIGGVIVGAVLVDTLLKRHRV